LQSPPAKPVERADELRSHGCKIALDALGAADHHVVGAWNALDRYDFLGERPEAALHSVAHDCAADFLRDREADAHRWIAILAIPDEEDEAGHARAQPCVCGEKVRALPYRC